MPGQGQISSNKPWVLPAGGKAVSRGPDYMEMELYYKRTSFRGQGQGLREGGGRRICPQELTVLEN